MKNPKWSNPKGKKNPITFKHYGFNTFTEMQKYVKKHNIKGVRFGYSKKEKHFFEYKMLETD